MNSFDLERDIYVACFETLQKYELFSTSRANQKRCASLVEAEHHLEDVQNVTKHHKTTKKK